MSHDAGGRTNTKRERKYFLVFLKMSVTQRGRLDRHNERELFYFFIYFIFYNFQIYFFLFFFCNIFNFQTFCFFFKENKEQQNKR